MKRLLSALALLAGFFANAQSVEESIMAISGAAGEEELDESEIELFEATASRRCALNFASRRQLLSSGLFSPYQTAAILDYRSRFGDILSPAELAAVDGFNMETAKALVPFLSFASNLLPGSLPQEARSSGTLLLRSNLKDGSFSWGMKTEYAFREMFSFSAALRNSFGAPLLQTGTVTFSLEYSPRKGKTRYIAGDFNARFGQGLGIWSGFSLSGLSGINSFTRRPSGLSSSRSWTKTGLRGLAAERYSGRMRYSAFLSSGPDADSSPAFGLNTGRFGRKADVSATLYGRTGPGFSTPLSVLRMSVEGRVNVRGAGLAGEAAYDALSGSAAYVGSISLKAGRLKTIVLARRYGSSFDSALTGAVRSSTKCSDETGLAAAAEIGGWMLSVDWAVRPQAGKRQFKALLTKELTITESLKLKLRLQERWRDYEPRQRVSARMDLNWERGRIAVNSRTEAAFCRNVGLLSYLESGLKGRDSALWLRGSVFFIDSWEDRIYVYERDVPGSFNVPAYYGRGFSLAGVAHVKKVIGRTRLRASLRAALTSYPFMDVPKPARAELHLQLTADL